MSNFDDTKNSKPNRKKIKKSRKERIHHRKHLKEKIDAFKLKIGCERCGYKKYAAALEFHHINPEDKTMSIGTMLFRGFSWERIVKEAKKCMLLCKNCHVEVHEEQKS